MSQLPTENLPLGTTPAFAGMHKWLQRGLFVCLTVLVLEGAFTFPLLAMWYGWPKLTLQEICSEFLKIQFADDTKECIYPYPLFGPPEGAGQTAARQDVWGVQPKPLYKRVEFGEFIIRRDERLARQAAAEGAPGEHAAPQP
jgi:hypothetical protein